MKKGDKVLIVSLVSERGVHYGSVEQEHLNKEVVTIEDGPDEIGCYRVKVKGVDGPLELHRSILKAIPKRWPY
jgi:hypothetical protein